MLQTIYQLQPGATAPDFLSNDRKNVPTNLI